MLELIYASGGTVPLLTVFPRVHFKDINATERSKYIIELTQPKSKDNRGKFIQGHHTHNYIKPLEENPCFMLGGNHSNHITIVVVTLARENHFNFSSLL